MSEETEHRLNATGAKYKETDKKEQEESEGLALAAMLPSLFPSQLVVLVISQPCFSFHILMLTYSNGASAILTLSVNMVCFDCSMDTNYVLNSSHA